MSKLRFCSAALAIAALSGLSVSHAQVDTLEPPTLQQDQNDRPQTDQGDRYEARRAAISARAGDQAGPTVKEALVQKLIKANEAEIELAKMASQQSDNQELKKLAQMIVQDHQQLNQKLQRHSGQTHARQRNMSQNRTSETPQPQGQLNQDRLASKPQSSHSVSGQHMATVPKQLCQVAEQACDNALKMTKEMLSGYDGQDFNMAFLGQQCVAHTMMLAELRAIESTGPQELQQLAGQAASKVKNHLEKAKQLAKKLEDDRRNRS